jgi:hypothetical protein
MSNRAWAARGERGEEFTREDTEGGKGRLTQLVAI